MPRKRRPRNVRPYGQGRIFQRGERWYCQYRGRRYATGSKDRSAAEEFLDDLKRKFRRGELTSEASGGAYKIGDLLDDFLKRAQLQPGTRRTYEMQARVHLKPFFGLMPVEKLDTDTLSDYREMRSTQMIPGRRIPVQGTTINRELAFLRSALNDLKRRRPKLLPLVPYFPMTSERDNVRKGFVREVDFRLKLYPELPQHLKPLAACAFYGGGRKSEWLTLLWKNVDFERWTAYFPETKNKRAREVPIFEGFMRDALVEAKRIRDEFYPHASHVFLYNGKPMKDIGSAWDKACERAGFPGLLFHDLRRSASKNMAEHGLPQGLRMKIQGHITDSMDRRYQIWDDVDMQLAREKMKG